MDEDLRPDSSISTGSSTQRGNADWFARITAALGLAVGLAAVVVPYVQSEKDKQENLTVVSGLEDPGVIRLSADQTKSRAVQVPYILTLSNAGGTKLSILSYQVLQLSPGGVTIFPGLDGGFTDREDKTVLFPLTLDGGESLSVRLHLGFHPTPEIQKTLSNMFHSGGALDSRKTVLALAEKGFTIYGGKATMIKNSLGTTVRLDPKTVSEAPTYKVTFLTGRKQEFSTILSPYPRL
jgi:hypothetical protein